MLEVPVLEPAAEDEELESALDVDPDGVADEVAELEPAVDDETVGSTLEVDPAGGADEVSEPELVLAVEDEAGGFELVVGSDPPGALEDSTAFLALDEGLPPWLE